VRLSRCEMRDHINYSIAAKTIGGARIDQQGIAAAEIAKARHLRDFHSPAILSFSKQSPEAASRASAQQAELDEATRAQIESAVLDAISTSRLGQV
jgi:hypothetical protein